MKADAVETVPGREGVDYFKPRRIAAIVACGRGEMLDEIVASVIAPTSRFGIRAGLPLRASSSALTSR
jgi:hypothetical protein